MRCPWPTVRRLKSMSEFRQHDSLLRLILAFTVRVTHLAHFISLEENDLAQTLVGVDLRRQGCGVGDLERDETFPLRLEGRDIHDNPAAGVGGFSHADGQHITRNLEVFNRGCQSEGVRRNNGAFRTYGDE